MECSDCFSTPAQQKIEPFTPRASAPFHHVHTPNTANPSPALPRPPSTIVVALLAGGGYAEATAAHRILSTGGHFGKVILTI